MQESASSPHFMQQPPGKVYVPCKDWGPPPEGDGEVPGPAVKSAER